MVEEPYKECSSDPHQNKNKNEPVHEKTQHWNHEWRKIMNELIQQLQKYVKN